MDSKSAAPKPLIIAGYIRKPMDFRSKEKFVGTQLYSDLKKLFETFGKNNILSNLCRVF